jgi:hypothetical protein
MLNCNGSHKASQLCDSGFVSLALFAAIPLYLFSGLVLVCFFVLGFNLGFFRVLERRKMAGLGAD